MNNFSSILSGLLDEGKGTLAKIPTAWIKAIDDKVYALNRLMSYLRDVKKSGIRGGWSGLSWDFKRLKEILEEL